MAVLSVSIEMTSTISSSESSSFSTTASIAALRRKGDAATVLEPLAAIASAIASID